MFRSVLDFIDFEFKIFKNTLTAFLSLVSGNEHKCYRTIQLFRDYKQVLW